MVIVIAGVSGSGKTTVGTLLAARLGWDFVDGDTLHPASNIAKMAAGIPLTDRDRLPWLAAITAWMDERLAAGESVVLACSALRRSYRDRLLSGRPSARLVFLRVDAELAAERLAGRHGHFFDPGLLDSQFAVLDPPVQPAESAVMVVSAADQPQLIADEIVHRLAVVR
ncbi:MAG TPA: gluconokinase [Streptosporangiaceae bacterium]|nr:gluconokinase [Streptosporangiaceae bacterium]